MPTIPLTTDERPMTYVDKSAAAEKFMRLAKHGRAGGCSSGEARAYNLAVRHLFPLARAAGALDQDTPSKVSSS